MIAEALDTEDERIQILPLTPKIREEHKVPLNCNNVHLFSVQLIEENGYEFLCISEASNISVVHTEARPISDDHNDLLAVIHELAHAKMTRFLMKNLHKMEWIVKTYEVFFLGTSPNLSAYINTRFETYLSERFAWEIEIQALKSMYGKYFDIWPTRFPQSIMTEPSRDISKNISKSITAIYDGFFIRHEIWGQTNFRNTIAELRHLIPSQISTTLSQVSPNPARYLVKFACFGRKKMP